MNWIKIDPDNLPDNREVLAKVEPMAIKEKK